MRWWLGLLVALAVVAALAAACGDDDDTTDGAVGDDTPTADGGGTADGADPADGDAADDGEAAPEGPRHGGEVTVLFYSEVGSLDPIRATASGGSDAQPLFALYGALVTLDPDTVEIETLLAESFEPNDDFTVWTLTLREGIVFSDGTPFEAEAVRAYWERIKDPANSSPAVTIGFSISDLAVVEPLVLEVTLARPNAHFDKAVERTAFNYVPSPTAVDEGVNLANEPVGAGPFLLESWVRDDRMVFVPNPDWIGSDGPYVDRYTIRVVTDEQQRSDTFVTGDAQLNFTNTILATVEAGLDAGAEWHYVTTPNSPVYMFNNQREPFDDVRVRRAFIQAIDHEAFIEIAGLIRPVTDWVDESSPWFTPGAIVAPYDPEAAQALFDEVAAETGGPIEITINAFQQSNDQLRAEFLQSTLNQYDNVNARVQVLASAEAIGAVLQKEFQVTSWGLPFIDPEPNLYGNINTASFTNFAGYFSPELDELLETGRRSDDFDTRYDAYAEVIRRLAEDVPWWPYSFSESGFLVAPGVRDVVLYHEYVLRADLMWLD